ncbi:PREDICTED: 39S ribosomal protein L18, mitochondrial [Nanorana parkeri]|uniref:39S ribosomal protein L18, mitochondrial n=1 Tax=Nanorana parkeri TaxID=125878 RepID=UPI000853F673|nr:PREDICTED: 39S ribosomal protein L18, mitochondrial [Nanorana parkeri]
MSVLLRGRILVQAIRPASSAASVQVTPAIEVDTHENEIVNPEFTNRNPRNLESLSLAVKDRGWGTVWPTRAYWHRLRLERSGYHVTALVEHTNGNIVLSASTKEWGVKKHLYSTVGATACENVGRVMAQRCLEAGIHYMLFREIPWVFRSESVQQFRKAMIEGGILLTEPPRIYQ